MQKFLLLYLQLIKHSQNEAIFEATWCRVKFQKFLFLFLQLVKHSQNEAIFFV